MTNKNDWLNRIDDGTDDDFKITWRKVLVAVIGVLVFYGFMWFMVLLDVAVHG